MTYGYISSHHLYPSDIITAFYGNYGCVRYDPGYQDKSNFYLKAYGPSLSQATHYIGIYCLHDDFTL